MGLPDMAPVHAAYVARMEEMVRSGGSELFIETLKNWGPMGEQSMALWQQMIGELTGAGGDKKRPRG